MRFADYLGEPDDDPDASTGPRPANPAFGRISTTPASTEPAEPVAPPPVDPAEPSTWPSPWAAEETAEDPAPTGSAPAEPGPGAPTPAAVDPDPAPRVADRTDRGAAPADDLMPRRDPAARPRRGWR
jgi:hypothetical protein